MSDKPALLLPIAAGVLGAAIGLAAAWLFGSALLTDRVTEAAVRETLRANPEIVVEALQAMQAKRADEVRGQQRLAIRANQAALIEDANSVVIGNPQGDVTLVEFFDYRCPYCRASLATVDALIRTDPMLRVVYKEFPVLGDQSLIASKLAVAARKDPRYRALHDALMMAPDPLDEAAALAIATQLGFDSAALAAAAKAPEVDEILRANHLLARMIGIDGTPAFIVGDTLTVGVVSLPEMSKLITDLRARGGDAAVAKAGG